MADARAIRCIFLDRASNDCNDLDFSEISQLTDFQAYDRTAANHIVQQAAGAAIIISNKVRLGRNEFEQLPDLKLVCVIATGTNNIDHDAAKEFGIGIMNVKDYAAAAVSQHVLLLMLALAGNFKAYQQDLNQGRWQQQDQFCLLNHPITSLQHKTLGLIGYGHIAKAVEQKARAFGMKVIIAQSLLPDAPAQSERVTFDDCLAQSDIISLHCPLSEYSRKLFTEAQFTRMKDNAFLINTARGGIIDEADLISALENRQIAGAALDCIEHEPPRAQDAIIQAQLPNLIITPHNAWGTREARQQLVNGTAQNIRLYLEARSA